MRKFLKFICAFVILIPCACFMTACGHQHNYSQAWSNDATHHWHDCSSANCNEKSGYAQHNFGVWTADPANPAQHKKTCADCNYVVTEEHTGGTATCQELAECDVCHTQYGNLAGHNYDPAVNSNATHHWYDCLTPGCPESGGYQEHDFGAWVIDPANPAQHKKTCADCEYVAYEAHTGGTATCQEKAECDVCHSEYGDFAAHNPDTDFGNNATHHWHDCLTAGCDHQADYAEHDFGAWTADPTNPAQHKKTCATCGYVAYEAHTGGTATCQELAECDVCHTEYGDFAGHNQATTLSHNDTHHWYECLTPGCDAKLSQAEHQHTIIAQHNETQHTESCVCGHVEYEDHNFNPWAVDPEHPDQHKRTCLDCEYVATEPHAFANGIQDCICGTFAPITTLSLSYQPSQDNYIAQSAAFRAQTGKMFAFSFVTGDALWLYPTLDFAVLNGATALTNVSFKLYDANKSLFADTQTCTGVEANARYYLVVEFTSLEGNPDVTLNITERDNAIACSTLAFNANGQIANFKYSVGNTLPTGTTVFMKPVANSTLVDKYGITVKKINTTTSTFDELLFVSTPYCSYIANEGIELIVEQGATYYISLTPAFSATQFALANFEIKQDQIIPTSTCSQYQTLTYDAPSGYEAGTSYIFKYAVNAAPVSEIVLDIQNSYGNSFISDGNADAYSMTILKLTAAGYQDITSDFDNDGELWRYEGTTSIASTTILIILTLNETQPGFYVDICQNDSVVLTRELDGGTLENNTPVVVEYGKTYLPTYFDLGLPTKSGYDFSGWAFKVDELYSSFTGTSGQFGGKWSEATLPDCDWYGNGQVTIYARWVNATRTVTLNPGSGGAWSGGGSANKTNVVVTNGSTLNEMYIPVRDGYTFAGYSETGRQYVNYLGVAQNLEKLTNTTANAYTLTAIWFQTVDCASQISVGSQGQRNFAFTTGDWGLPVGQLTAPVIIELAGVDANLYEITVKEVSSGASIGKVEGVYNLKALTPYYIVVTTYGTSLINKTLAITRDWVVNTNTSPTTYEIRDIDFDAGEKVILKINPTTSGNYTLKTTQQTSYTLSKSGSISSIKFFAADMTLITDLTETTTGNGEYYLAHLTAGTVHYVEIVFSANRVSVNFILQ